MSLIGLCSCSSKANVEEFITLNPSDSLSVFLGLPTSVKYLDDKLFVVDPFDEKGFIKIIDTFSDSILCTFANKGEGPYEYLHIANVDPYFDSKDRRLKIDIFDPVSLRLGLYDCDSLLILKEDYCPNIRKVSVDSLRFHEMLKLKTGYIATGLTEKNKYTVLSDSLTLINQYGSYRPKPSSSISDLSHVFANYGHSVLSPNRDKLAEIIYNASVLSCYDTKTQKKEWEYLIKELNYHVDGGDGPVNDEPQGFLSASFYNDKIVALYSGRKDNPDAIATYGNELHVLNANGELERKYKLANDGFYITIDSERKVIYLLSHTPESAIYIYDIPY